MTDYISREALLERVSKVKDKLELDLNKPFDDGVRIGFENVEIEIENFPAADVREVKRGKWIPYNPLESGNAVNFQCSNCNTFYQMEVPNRTHDFDYCPSCGVYMREKPTNEWLRKYQMPTNCGADMREEQT